MYLRRSILIATVIFACSISAFSQTVDVDDIVLRALAARGGLEQIKAVKSLRMSGKINFTFTSGGHITVEMKRPGKMRQDFKMGTKTLVQVTDGHTGYSFDFPLTAPAKDLTYEEIKNMSSGTDFDGPLVDAKQKGNTIEYLGKTKVEGRDNFELKITMKDGSVRSDFLDCETLLESKWEGTVTNDGKVSLTRTFFHDYRPVNGIMFPYKLISAVIGSPDHQEIVFDSVEVDPDLSDSLFTKP